MNDLTEKAYTFLESIKDERRQVQIDAVNFWVNQNLSYRVDTFKGKKLDQWHKPLEILKRGADDCDGSTTVKGWMLRSLGIECWMLLVKVHGNEEFDHMVLEVPAIRPRFLWWGKKPTNIILDNRYANIYPFEHTEYKRHETRRVAGNQNFWLGAVNKRTSERGPLMYS